MGQSPEMWACKCLRTKHFHGVSSGNQHPYLLKSRYGKVSAERLSATPAWQGPRSDDMPGRAFPVGLGWHRVLLLSNDSLCVVPAPGAPSWHHHVYASDVGGGDYASGRAGRDALDAGTHRAAGGGAHKSWCAPPRQ